MHKSFVIFKVDTMEIAYVFRSEGLKFRVTPAIFIRTIILELYPQLKILSLIYVDHFQPSKRSCVKRT